MNFRSLLLLLFSTAAIAQTQTPKTIPQIYAQHPAATLTGGEILLGSQGGQPAVGILASQIAAYVGGSIFSPGCALGGTFNSQVVNLSAGPFCVIGTLPLTNVTLTAPAATTLSNVGPIPQWIHVGQLTFSSFATASTSNSIALFQLPASGVISGVRIKQSASFTGGSISAYTLSVGDAGAASAYSSAYDVFQAPGATVYKLAQPFGGESATAFTTINVTATSTGANLSAATAGSVDIWCLVSVAL